MSDYDKLTVVKLREELVQRGLPKTGLKAVLVQRLLEADAQSHNADADPGKASPQPALEPHQEIEVVTLETSAPAEEDETENVSGNDAPLHVEQKPQEPETTAAKNYTTVARDPEKDSSEDADALQDNPHPGRPSTDIAEQPSISKSLDEDARPEQNLDSENLPEKPTEVVTHPDSVSRPATPTETVSTQTEREVTIAPTSAQVSITGEELQEDRRKRKRRSQSPPPSSTEVTQKRLKADDGRSHINLPEDSTIRNLLPEKTTENSRSHSTGSSNVKIDSLEANGYAEGSKLANSGITASGEQEDTDRDAPTLNGLASSEPHVTPPKMKSTQPFIKASPSDARFKNLLAPSSKPLSEDRQTQPPESEDRAIDAALHPATSALYIRELMRPLKAESIRDHLVSLATPADAPIDPNVVTDFFLDSIRTHCLAGFNSISAASRVRSGLHDRIWPNERDRRALWVDFVPEEKLKKWIDVEENAPTGRGQPSKRWEVVYEDEDGYIKAYLQEVGSNSGGLRTAQPAKGDTGQGVQGAPSGSRTKEPQSQARPDHGKSFKALDDLFKSTNAKPKLYYLPAPRAEVERRQERLSAGRGGAGNDEMRRYTFEEDVIVDKGPEFGNRGGRGGRGGGYSGSYRGRGGGYRGETYRGDFRRDRRPAYY